jgi:hypothetical protein
MSVAAALSHDGSLVDRRQRLTTSLAVTNRLCRWCCRKMRLAGERAFVAYDVLDLNG